MDNDKKTAAAITAVISHIAAGTAEDSRPSMDYPDDSCCGSEDPSSKANMWSVSGRQAQMQARLLMQMRTFCR